VAASLPYAEVCADKNDGMPGHAFGHPMPAPELRRRSPGRNL
jgi:hypothetical protein